MNRAVVVIAVASALVMAVGACSSTSNNGHINDGADAGGIILVCDETALAGVDQCTKSANLTMALYNSLSAMCTQQGGKIAQACPTAGVIGCCSEQGVEGCFYPGSAAMTAAQCAMVGGTWSTTP